MKRKTLVIGTMMTLLAAGTVAQAGPGFGPGGGPGKHCNGDGPHVEQRLERMSAHLDLTEEQRAQVQAIMNERLEKAAPLREQMMEIRGEMRQATAGGNFDEAQVREIAARKAKIQEEMTVAHAEARSRIQAVLTPEQQAKMGQGMGKTMGRRGGNCW